MSQAVAAPYTHVKRPPESDNDAEYWQGLIDTPEFDWIYTYEYLHDETPSRRVSNQAKRIGFTEECQKRAKGIVYLYACCRQLKLSRSVALTASCYFHRFYMRRDFAIFHYFEIAATALFTACKADECRRKLGDVVKVCSSIALQGRMTDQITEESKIYWKWKDVVTNLEELLLEVLCFDMTPENPYKVCMDTLDLDFEMQTGADSDRQIFMECTNFFEVLSRLPLALLYTPEVVCALGVALSCHRLEKKKPGYLERLHVSADKVWECYDRALDLSHRLQPLRPQFQVPLVKLTKEDLQAVFAPSTADPVPVAGQ